MGLLDPVPFPLSDNAKKLFGKNSPPPSSGDQAQMQDTLGVSDALEVKAEKDLANVDSFAVVTRLYAPRSINFDKLDDNVRASLGNGLEPSKNQGSWYPATNTPVIPSPVGVSGNWYRVAASGVATGNASGTYNIGDEIYSNNVVWQVRPVAPTNIPDSSLPLTKLDGTFIQNDTLINVGSEGVKTGIFGFYATNGTGGRKAIWAIDKDGRQWPDPSVGVAAGLSSLTNYTTGAITGLQTQINQIAPVTGQVAQLQAQVSGLGPITGYANDGGIPIQKVQYWTLSDQKYVVISGEYHQLAYGETTASGTKLLHGYTVGGISLPIVSGEPTPEPTPTGTGIIIIISGSGSNYVPPSGLIYQGDPSGLVYLSKTGESYILNSGNYQYPQHVNESKWLIKSDFFGSNKLCMVNVQSGLIMPFEDQTINQVLWNGQSLSVGTSASPILSATPVYAENSLMFSAGSQAGTANIPLVSGSLTGLVPMIEIRNTGSNNSYESPLSAFANRSISGFDAAFGFKPTFLQANHGYGGARLSLIRKGTTPYSNGVIQMQAGKDAAAQIGKPHKILAVCVEHGQADENFVTPTNTYKTGIIQLRLDYDTDAKAITNQTNPVYMFINQVSSWSHYAKVNPLIAPAQLQASEEDPFIVCIGPEYHLDFAGDGVHLRGTGSYRYGEYYSKAMMKTLFGKEKFQPLKPTGWSQDANAVYVSFNNQYPLAWNTGVVAPVFNAASGLTYGFEISGATYTGVPFITGNTVVIPKSGSASTVAYAWTSNLVGGTGRVNGGPVTGPRGNLHQANPDISILDGKPLFDWCVHFNKTL